jgi:type I restriction enzyme R subunit
MWMTGFDVPPCSTIYLDKPMRNHTLMQTIARANRVFGDKANGLIVDYIGVFRDLQAALAIYGSASGGGVKEGEMPVMEKSELVDDLKAVIAETRAFCKERGINLDAILEADKFLWVKLRDDAVNAILINDNSKSRYLVLATTVAKLYKAVLPDPAVNEMTAICRLIKEIADRIRSLIPDADITEAKEGMEELLDASLRAEPYVIPEEPESHIVNLAELDFDKLRDRFERSCKFIEVEKLKVAIRIKLQKMILYNRTRMNYLEQFQEMLAFYNAGSMNIDELFRQLVAFAQSLAAEEQRSIAENLTEEELAIFDHLTKPDMKLSEKAIKQVKKVARQLLETLKVEKLVLDWRKHQQSQAAVRVTIKRILDELLPRAYTPKIYRQKCNSLYQHVYESYYGEGGSVYGHRD